MGPSSCGTSKVCPVLGVAAVKLSPSACHLCNSFPPSHAAAFPGKFGHSAAVGLVPVPKPQQALFTKQTWTYASAPGA